MERAVARGLAARPASVPARVGVDEKAAGRGQDHIAVVSNLDAGAVEYLADERRQASLDGFRARFSTEQGRGVRIEAVALAGSIHVGDADASCGRTPLANSG